MPGLGELLLVDIGRIDFDPLPERVDAEDLR